MTDVKFDYAVRAKKRTGAEAAGRAASLSERSKKFAFTLAELLMSVLVISIIMIALAPVLTKRVADNIKINLAQKESHLFLYDEFDTSCSAAPDEDNALDCVFTTPAGVKSVNAIVVSGGGGGAGATTPTTDHGTDSATSGSKTIPITKAMRNVSVSYLTGGGGGGGGGSYSQTNGGAPTSQADCDKFNAKFLTAAQNGGKAVCATKYNVGDANGPGLASTVSRVNPGTSCSYSSTGNRCCWNGGTTAGGCDANNGGYSGCNRTVCNWQAASDSCAQWAPTGTSAGDWRLPTRDELSAWASNIGTISKNQGSAGLMLCDYYSGYGSAQCNNVSSCPGSYYGGCGPYEVWSSTPTGSDYYYRYLYSGRFLSGSRSPGYAFSARCVLEKGAQRFSSFGAGGGGAAPYYKNYPIQENIINQSIGGTIKLTAGAGGGGGAAATASDASASAGSAGSTSTIEVYNAAGILIWGLKVPGGNAGGAAQSSNYGTGGAQKAVDTCRTYNGSSWVAATCSGWGAAGNDGQKIVDSTNTAAGGVGGGSAYNSSVYEGGGAGGSSSSAHGQDGQRYGAGGGGGTVKFTVSGTTVNVSKGNGGKGANGIAEITYDLLYQGAGGGGGGGGAFAKIKDIPVAPETTYTVRVGGGGAGGAVSNKGSNGGTSAVTFGTYEYSLSGGVQGLVGTSATASSDVIHGTGGQRGIVYTSVSDKSNLDYKNGSDGSNGGDFAEGSTGGNGGDSGINTKGGCGGMFNDSEICTNTNVNGTSAIFIAPGNVFETAEYGAAGAGGAGGGWNQNTSTYPNPGGGAGGQNGYVYIYWTKY